MASSIVREDNTRQVKVDNWGIFFLQRLQHFFNRTDYCDLTLQFENNIQLKVHRLVLNACTEYFQTLEVSLNEYADGVLVMPKNLQPDVVVPIINFMYTGMLEFQLSNFEKLYRTAKLMNIAVLTKLLDAQTSTFPASYKQNINQPLAGTKRSQQVQQQALLSNLGSYSATSAKVKKEEIIAPHKNVRKLVACKNPLKSFDLEKKTPTRVIFTPKGPRGLRSISQRPAENPPKPTRFEWPITDVSSSFGDISYDSAPLLKPEEVDEMILTQKTASTTSITSSKRPTSPPSHVESQEQIACTDKAKVKRVKLNIDKSLLESEALGDSAEGAGKLDHAKIISHVLKSFPQLVQSTKNIKLRIMKKNANSSSEADYNSTNEGSSKSCEEVVKVTHEYPEDQENPSDKEKDKDQRGYMENDGSWTCRVCKEKGVTHTDPSFKLFKQHLIDIHSLEARQCDNCSYRCYKNIVFHYHKFTKHQIESNEYTFPKCKKCSFIALTDVMMTKHMINHRRQCNDCEQEFTTYKEYVGHSAEFQHNDVNNDFDCCYCTEKFEKLFPLLQHMRTRHTGNYKEDFPNVKISLLTGQSTLKPIEKNISERSQNVEILSDVKIDPLKTPVELSKPQQPSSEAESLSKVASGIAASLGLNNAIVVLDEQQYVVERTQQEVHEIVHIGQHELNEDQSQCEVQSPTESEDTLKIESERIEPIETSSPSQIHNEESQLPRHVEKVKTVPEKISIDASNARQVGINTMPASYVPTVHSCMTSANHASNNVTTNTVESLRTKWCRLDKQDVAKKQSLILTGASSTTTDELVMTLSGNSFTSNDPSGVLIPNENSNIVLLYSHSGDINEQSTQFISHPGSIILSQPTGLMNMNQAQVPMASSETVTGTQALIAVSNNQSMTMQPVTESIEMIQQEIDQHLAQQQQQPAIDEKQCISEAAISQTDESTHLVVENDLINEGDRTVEENQKVIETEESQVEVKDAQINEGKNEGIQITPSQNKFQKCDEETDVEQIETYEVDEIDDTIEESKNQGLQSSSAHDLKETEEQQVNTKVKMVEERILSARKFLQGRTSPTEETSKKLEKTKSATSDDGFPLTLTHLKITDESSVKEPKLITEDVTKKGTAEKTTLDRKEVNGGQRSSDQNVCEGIKTTLPKPLADAKLKLVDTISKVHIAKSAHSTSTSKSSETKTINIPQVTQSLVAEWCDDDDFISTNQKIESNQELGSKSCDDNVKTEKSSEEVTLGTTVKINKLILDDWDEDESVDD